MKQRLGLVQNHKGTRCHQTGAFGDEEGGYLKKDSVNIIFKMISSLTHLSLSLHEQAHMEFSLKIIDSISLFHSTVKSILLVLQCIIDVYILLGYNQYLSVSKTFRFNWTIEESGFHQRIFKVQPGFTYVVDVSILTLLLRSHSWYVSVWRE